MRKDLKKICKKFNIGIVYIFGSFALGIETEKSDIDIGIVFKDNSYISKRLDIYSELYKVFSDIFPKREVDIVFLNDANLLLKFEVVTTGKVIYAEPIDYVMDYKEKIIKEYIDFKPMLEVQNRILLEMVSKR